MLAQADSSSLTRLIPALVILIIVVAVLLAGLSMLRRRMKSDTGSSRDFTLGDLRRLRAEGKITEEELERAKSALVGRVHTSLAKEAKPSGAPPMETEVKD